MRTEGRLLARLGEILTRDYASRLDPYIKWIRNPLAVLTVAAIAAVLCGLFLHPRALVLSAGLVAVLVAGTVWPWLSVRGVGATISFGRERVREGESVEVRLLVRNRMPWTACGLSLRGVVLDEDARGATSGLAFAPGWRTVECRWTVVPNCRGEYPAAAPRIATAFPFGLLEASRPLAIASRLLVWPRTFPVGPLPEAACGREGDGIAPRNKAGSAGDLLGVRPYRRGDSLRRVHWPQSARHGQLIACELEALAIPRVQVVLDIAPGAHVGAGSGGSFEWAVRVAASFAEDWTAQGAEVEIVLGGRSVAASAGAVTVRRARLLDALARVEPDASRSLCDVLGGPSCVAFNGGLRVVVATDRSVLARNGKGARGGAERFVMLHAGAFADCTNQAVPGALPIRPWIWIDDPLNVPSQVRRAWKEVAVDR